MRNRFMQQSKTLAAIFLLFLTQFLYFYLEADFGTYDRYFSAAELIFFYVFYTFSLLDSIIAELIWTILGCAALGVLRGRLFGFYAVNTTIFLAHLPICLFMLVQDLNTKRQRQSPGIILTGFCPMLVFGYLIWYTIKYSLAAERIFGMGVHFDCFTFPALIILYYVIRRVPIGKNTKEAPVRDLQRDCFLFALFSMVETFFMLRIYDASALIFTVSLFWLMNLLILYRKRNPLLCVFFKKFDIRL